ncbi:MAG TPA: OCRE domain-containing protein [Jatrophihabitans sp.]|nr:OCRE domain-containing protein [Jatrophihabitans sp.]
MSPTPYTQSSASAMIRNFGTGAQLMAMHLRQTGASASGAGDAGLATAEQSELHASWFDQVASNTADAADRIDTLVATGNQHQATAQTVYSSYQQAVQRDSGANASGMDDMNVIHQSVNGSNTLSAAVNDWGSSYSGLKMPAAPRPPSSTGGSRTSTGSTSYAGTTSSSGTTATSGTSNSFTPSATPQQAVIDRGPGVPGSVEVGPNGGEFAGWYHDPRTGYYIDPQTGREFDPVTNRWVDPVTGLPFGDVTKYATGLQGLGGPSTAGGLFADTSATAGTGIAGLTGTGGFAGLVGTGSPTTVAGFYGGMLPPSLASGSAASSSLWQQASRSLGVKQDVAASLIAHEQAARAGRAYLPPSQAGLGASGSSAGRARPGYLTAEEEEAGLFSSRTGRRAYLPPTQAGTGKDEKKRPGGDRPDWLVDDDVFRVDPAPSGVLGDERPAEEERHV